MNTRRSIAKTKATAALSAITFLAVASAFGGSGVTASATAAPITVDARDLSQRRIVSPEALTYSPCWLEAANGVNRSVRIDVVTNPDTQNAATNTLITTVNGTESAYDWTPSTEAQPFCRLLHWTLDGGAPTGAPLVCDAVIGIPSAVATTLSADTRTNSLQEVANANGMAGLTYSPLWQNGSSARIERVRQRTDTLSVTTNNLFQSAAGIESVYALSMGGLASGHYILRHITLNASSQPVGDALTAEFDLQRPRGTLIRVF